MTTKSKSKAKPKPKSNGKAPDLSAVTAYAKKALAEYNVCDTIRLVVQRFGKQYRRRDLLAVLEQIGVNKFTARRQYQLTKSGAIEVEAGA